MIPFLIYFQSGVPFPLVALDKISVTVQLIAFFFVHFHQEKLLIVSLIIGYCFALKHAFAFKGIGPH